MKITVKGHLHVQDDLGEVYVDKWNAIHPQNFARVFARALSNEDNHGIYRIAIGNGGTTTDAAHNVIYNTPNDGISPDIRTWDSRMYSEIYSEIVDEGTVESPNINIGVDPGSAGPNIGTRTGGASVPLSDPVSIPNVSGPGVRSIEEGLLSRVLIVAVINADEPIGMANFTFDEVGLYTAGATAIASAGYQNVGYGNKTSTYDTGLSAGTTYDFGIDVNGVLTLITLTTPASGGSGSGGEILYGDLCEALNTGDIDWNSTWSPPASPLGNARVTITDNTTLFPSIMGSSTNGFLQFISSQVGSTSTIEVTRGTANDLFTALGFSDDSGLATPVDGQDAGVQNDPSSSDRERERLLTHLIFEPKTRSAGRELTFRYSLYISVAQSEED